MPPHPGANPGMKERAAERRVRALQLRIEGKSFAQIGAEMGISLQGAHQHVTRALADLAKLEQGKARHWRRLEGERLDHLLRQLAPGIQGGDPASVNSAVRVLERRAKLLGLDAPVRQVITGAKGQALFDFSDADLQRIVHTGGGGTAETPPGAQEPG